MWQRETRWKLSALKMFKIMFKKLMFSSQNTNVNGERCSSFYELSAEKIPPPRQSEIAVVRRLLILGPKSVGATLKKSAYFSISLAKCDFGRLRQLLKTCRESVVRRLRSPTAISDWRVILGRWAQRLRLFLPLLRSSFSHKGRTP